MFSATVFQDGYDLYSVFMNSVNSKISVYMEIHTCKRQNKNSCKEHTYRHLNALCTQHLHFQSKKNTDELFKARSSLQRAICDCCLSCFKKKLNLLFLLKKYEFYSII